MSELDETRLLTLIAQTACDLTGAAFAAFSLRPVNEQGQPLVPSEGHLFHLAAIVGVTDEQAQSRLRELAQLSTSHCQLSRRGHHFPPPIESVHVRSLYQAGTHVGIAASLSGK